METMNEISGYLSNTSDADERSDDKDSVSMEDSEEETSKFRTKRKDKSASANRPIHSKASNTTKSSSIQESLQRYDFIPMRLTEHERKLLNVLENALDVCEYTDVVDVTFSHTRKSKVSRIMENLVDVLSISCGLLMSNNLSKGEQLLAGKTLSDNVPLFTDLFEVGRRYKIMNPTKMRDTYGKLMYILMDTESHTIKSDLQFTFVKPILTVSIFLRQHDSLHILSDPLWAAATQSINNVTGEKSKIELATELQDKMNAEKKLKCKYTSDVLSENDIQRVIDSIADNQAYLAFNMSPVTRIINTLKDSFHPLHPSPEAPQFSLQLQGTGRGGSKKASSAALFSSFSNLYGGYSSGFMGGGACLSHDHATQYRFVLQSFMLWKEIMCHMPKLWLLADADITKEMYRLVDTGQGYQRLQCSPRVSAEMTRILRSVQQQVGSPWVGLSVVHLGDRDVPNALIFIDKYTQVPRILAPIVQCIESLPRLVEDTAFHSYVSQEWGSINGLRMQILSDFFKHGFDGSGDDGGSCIDGRLTSAWNWCSKLHKKPYYHAFMFTGFQGFDGDWKET